ncbi:hypothetical protein GCM10010156_52720 [Planobispora rosea]|uniref:Uncharacterized protein n=2 Tax=Planobispora rosea TaxID=35762 RepID=A0A8J3WE72_PLARO|nr:hypothetical protein GCM10010156_52720 [Planobispora rosea]GIH86674.1 hypothetical protein Pro02_50820 [Planobispora rosea]
MPKMVLLASHLTIAGNDLSDRCAKIELTAEVEEKDVTTYASAGWKEVLGGLASGTLSVRFKQDYAASEVDATMWALFLTRSPQTFSVRADQAAVGASNPSYSGQALIKQWKPLAGSVGDVAEVDVSWPTSGAITRATS